MLALQLVAGAVVVAAFAGVQLRLLDPHRLPYLLANVVSTGVLAAVAVHEAQWGFVLTNGFWAAISAVGLVQLARGRRVVVEPPP